MPIESTTTYAARCDFCDATQPIESGRSGQVPEGWRSFNPDTAQVIHPAVVVVCGSCLTTVTLDKYAKAVDDAAKATTAARKAGTHY
jgi:hypothetical protein